MQSLRSRLFIGLLRISGKIRFRLKGRRPDTSVAGIHRLRRTTEKGSGLLGRLPADVAVEPVHINGMYAEWILPAGIGTDAALLYFHGGGYVIGSAAGHRAIVAKFAAGSGVRALCFDYALAPENPFPAALNNALDAFSFLRNNGLPPERIVFMGDSAGGGLCLATLLALKENNQPLPAAAVVLSPWTDLKNTGDSLRTNIEADPLTWRDSWIDFSNFYAAENDPGNPLISPLYGNLHGLPPLLIYVGNDELLRDDSTRFARKAQEAGVAVTLRAGAGMFHCYPACAPIFPEATAAKKEIVAFIAEHIRA